MGEHMLQESIEKLIAYANETGLLPECENMYAVNALLALFKEDAFEGNFFPEKQPVPENVGLTSPYGPRIEGILKELLDIAAEKGLLPDNTTTYRDLFDAKIMDCVMPRPKTVIDTFYGLYEKDKKAATDWFYKFSQDNDYIRRYRLVKDVRYTVDSRYGTIEISINLSKPEKDPKAIAAAKAAAQTAYPKCQLCAENEGYFGRGNHPGRSSHRVIPMALAGAKWGFQYSPYGYYNEHCILFNMEHVPMKIERATFDKLLSFVEVMPHYMLGSNADLPIVGGSILSHDHYQGGCHDFPMALAPIVETVSVAGVTDVSVGIVNWPLSCLRLRSENKESMIDLATKILDAWRGYTDEARMVFAETDGEPHNTITPIARMHDGLFELDLVLRNNLTTEERPLGLYHPRPEYHHIKKENIGLIEVMGLAVLPARLKEELRILGEMIVEGKDLRSLEATEKHADWAEKWLPNYTVTKDNITDIINAEVGKVFVGVLEDAGVYKATEEGREGIRAFLKTIK